MKRFLFCSALLIASSLAYGPALAAVNLYLKLDGIDGESQDKAHLGWIDILSYRFGVTNSVGGAQGTGRATFSELSVTKVVDKSSPSLLFDTASVTHIENGLLDVVEAGQPSSKPFLEYKFTNLLVSDYSVGSGGDRPEESLSLNFTKIQFTAFPQNPDGTFGTPITMDWDVIRNSGSLSVPEPSSWAILAAGMLVVAFRAGRMMQTRAR